MQRLFLALLVLICSCAVAKDADKIIFDDRCICLNTVVSGLNWNGGRWVTGTFQPLGQFQMEIMIIETMYAGGSKQQFIHFNWDGDQVHEHCGMETSVADWIWGGYSCTQLGQTIVFSKETSRGGISTLLGSTSTASARDTLMVAPFTCQKM